MCRRPGHGPQIDRDKIHVVLLEPVLDTAKTADRGVVLADLRETPSTRAGSVGSLGPNQTPTRPKLQRRMSRVFDYGIDVDKLPVLDPNAAPVSPRSPGVTVTTSPEPATATTATPSSTVSPNSLRVLGAIGMMGRVDSATRKHKSTEQHASWDTLRRVSQSRLMPNAFSSLSRAMLDSLGSNRTTSGPAASADQQDTDQLQLLFDSIDLNHDHMLEVL